MAARRPILTLTGLVLALIVPSIGPTRYLPRVAGFDPMYVPTGSPMPRRSSCPIDTSATLDLGITPGSPSAGAESGRVVSPLSISSLAAQAGCTCAQLLNAWRNLFGPLLC